MKIEEMMGRHQAAENKVKRIYEENSAELRKMVRHLFENQPFLFTPHFHYPELRVSIHPRSDDGGCPVYLVNFSDVVFFISASGANNAFVSSVYKAIKEGSDED